MAKITGYGKGAPVIQLAPVPVSSPGMPSGTKLYDVGQLVRNRLNGNWYIYSGGGVYAGLAGGSASISTLTGSTGTATPSAGNIQIAGTAQQITTAASGAVVTLSLPSTVAFPGNVSIPSGSELTLSGSAGLLMEAGNFQMGGGDMILANLCGVSGAMTAGTITVANLNVDANSVIQLTHKAIGGTAGHLSCTINAGVSFTINSTSSTDTSTVSWFFVRPI